ncbi:MAG: methyltransferase domain-containing protein [Thermoguttaceae bacterium]|nr:methyltransferase domain-containing protein [Thermoguttaceae bacterium]MDW8079974.1 methyltransferase domain-containing protein [Thermoguttaceae bacterium]
MERHISPHGRGFVGRIVHAFRLSGSFCGRFDTRAAKNPAPRGTRLLSAVLPCTLIVLMASQLFAAEVRRERPRLFLSPGQVEQLRERTASIPLVQETYQRMREFAYGQWMNKNLWITPDELCTVLVVYLVENRDPKLLSRIRQYLEFFREAEGDHWTRPRMLKALSLAYDWLVDDLTPEERRQLGQRIVHLTQLLKQAYRHSDYNNQVYLQYGPLVYAALTLAHEPEFAQEASQLLAESEELLQKHFLPTVNQVGGNGDGGWHEGMAYFSFFAYELAHQLEAWRTATGENLFAAAPGLRGAARWLVYCTRPHDRSMAPVADIRTPAPWGWQESALLVLLANRYRDGLAQWALSQVPPGHPVRGWPLVIWYDPAVKPTSPETLPTGTLFSGIGWVATRSNWTDDAVWALFVCGPYYAGHQHSDQNSFLISHSDELAIDAGGYGAKETHWHNTLLIGNGQRLFRTDPRRFFGPIEKGSPFDTGRIVAFEENQLFTYAVGDAGLAYASNPAESPSPVFLRRFIFLKPRTFVIDDWVEPAGKEQPISWLMHSVNRPSVNDRQFSTDNGGSRLVGRSLLPARGEIRVSPRKFTDRKKETWQLAIEAPTGQPARFLTVLHVQGVDQSPAELKLDWNVDDSGNARVEIQTAGRTYQLELPPAHQGAGWVRVAEGGEVVLERRPWASGILPYTPEGLSLLARWDSAYRGESRPAWDVGRAASQLVEAVEQGLLRPGRAIELGCGLGHDARFLAGKGFDVTAVDISPTAIARAAATAEKEGVKVRFLVADVLRMPDLGTFDLVYDRGCYHGVRRTSAKEYVQTLRQLTRPGSVALILAGNAREVGTGGPPRVSEEEIREDFSRDFEIAMLRETRFDRRDAPGGGALAWMILLRRKAD